MFLAVGGATYRAPPVGGAYTYGFPLVPSLRVTVQRRAEATAAACVSWDGGMAVATSAADGRDVLLGEPLATYARQAGVEVVGVDGDAERMRVHFDGRVTFCVDLVRVPR